jgi:hypothetical protein
MVLNASAENRCSVELGRALAGNSRPLWITDANDFGDAPGCIVGDDAFDLGMCFKETVALRECRRVRLDGFDHGESCGGTTDQVLFDLDPDLVQDAQRPGVKQLD